MIKINRRLFVQGAAAVSAASVLATPQILRAQGSVKLRFGHPHPETDSWQDAGKWMAEQLAERSGGEISLDIFPNGILGNDSTMINSVRGGTLDLMVTGNPFFTGLAPQLNVLDLPYLFHSREHVGAVLDGELGDELRMGLAGSGLKALSTWETGWRHITNSRRPVHTPDDVKGLKIRTTPNPAHIMAFELLGAVPTPMAFTELFTALEMRSIDGQENPTTLILNSNFYEIQKYISLTGHAFTSSPLVMNETKFNGLGADQQTLLVSVAAEAAKLQRQMNTEREGTALAALKENGMEAVEDIDQAAFRAIVEAPIKEDFSAKFGPELIDRITALAS
ncbi:TRAP transporter substrate-binding protein [Paracoccus denitrificans]|uniref:TRAP transporter substrate-binding protein n=1 Tax=Paracoccus denitrificans TaxID=266 RepID=UPI000CEBE1C6|nr:TRAP transporter substrate-binding protein [Paracoccus denitrificans]